MSKPKVILDPCPRKIDWIFSKKDFQRLESLVEIIWGRDECMPQGEFDKVKGELSAVITFGWRFGPLDGMSELCAIAEVAGGFPRPQCLDYGACFKRGIQVLSCAPAFGPVVAELALGLAIASARQILVSDKAFRECKEVYSRSGNENSFSLYGKKVGMIGFGNIARSLKSLLEPFHCEFLVYDPWAPQEYLEQHRVRPVNLDALLKDSDFIFTLAVPTRENAGMLSRDKLELIGPDSVLVLVSRSQILDFDALIDMLNADRFRAAIDVFPQEPMPEEHPVRKAKNVILTPHIAGHVPENFRMIGKMLTDDLEAIFKGLSPSQMQLANPGIIEKLE